MRWFYDLNGDSSSESVVQYSVIYKSAMSFEHTSYITLFNFPNFVFAYFDYFLTFNRFIYIIEILDCFLCTSSGFKIINATNKVWIKIIYKNNQVRIIIIYTL